MRRAVPLIAACLLTLIAAQPLFAQQRLFALNDRQLVEIDLPLPSLGAVMRTFSFPDGYHLNRYALKDHVFPFLGGAYLVWVLGGHVSLLDTRSGAIQQFTFPDFVPDQIIGTDGNTRLVMSSGVCSISPVTCGATGAHARILVADERSGSVRVLDLGPSRLVGPIAYAAASDLLFVAKPRREEPFFGIALGRDFFDVDILQMSAGAVLKTLDVSPLDTNELQTNAAGTRVFVNRRAAFDAITGALTGSSMAPLPQFPALVVDDQRGRLIVGAEQLQAFSMDSLSLLGTTELPAVPFLSGSSPGRIDGDTDVSGQSATIFLARSRVLETTSSLYACETPQLAAIDADTGRVRAIADASSFLVLRTRSRHCSVDLIRITEPAPPLGFSAQASGHQVTLEWQATLNATSYEVEAGSLAGLSNLARLTVGEAHLTVEGVPSGVYHLRVRAINTIGPSAPSEEIRLVVQ